jgi:hypothetical protein
MLRVSHSQIDCMHSSTEDLADLATRSIRKCTPILVQVVGASSSN